MHQTTFILTGCDCCYGVNDFSGDDNCSQQQDDIGHIKEKKGRKGRKQKMTGMVKFVVSIFGKVHLSLLSQVTRHQCAMYSLCRNK